MEVEPMWLFTKYGFYSAVCARKGAGEPHHAVDPDRIMVRARVKAHLQSLQARFPALLAGCEIQEFPHSDYAHRLFVEKSVWTQVVQELADEIDYDNFKSEVARFQGRAGRDYEHALHDVWAVMHRLQR
jgi:hypothetical protein